VRYVLSHAPDVVEDELLEYIASAGDDGRSGTELRDHFGRHGSTDRTAALARLEKAGLIAKTKVKGKGRPKTRWVAAK
jgi:DNA-binding MarR family transcriptional regulator